MSQRGNRPSSSTPAFRRRIEVSTRPEGPAILARAVLEDDFHHFRVELKSLNGVLAAIDGAAPRHPYTLCKSAIEPLRRLVGMPLGGTAHAVTRFTDASEQCTHLLDLAGLAVAAASRGTAQRRYEIEVPDRESDGRTAPRLWRDGELLLDWQVSGDLIEGPPPFAGIQLRAGLARWALTTLPDELAEAVLVLRRCTVISVGRTYDLDLQIHARPTGTCYAQQPARAAQAIRLVGSTRDFSASPGNLCADDARWLLSGNGG